MAFEYPVEPYRLCRLPSVVIEVVDTLDVYPIDPSRRVMEHRGALGRAVADATEFHHHVGVLRHGRDTASPGGHHLGVPVDVGADLRQVYEARALPAMAHMLIEAQPTHTAGCQSNLWNRIGAIEAVQHS
jgi:hypothetical protein